MAKSIARHDDLEPGDGLTAATRAAEHPLAAEAARMFFDDR